MMSARREPEDEMARSLLQCLGAMAMLAMTNAGPAHAEVVEKLLDFTLDGARYEGALVYDEAMLAAKGKLPGVMVVHQWMGPTDYEHMRAKMLAELGYAAFIADVYGLKVRPKDAKEAGEAASRFKGDRALLRKILLANFEQLLAQPEVDKGRTAAIGYCFGGTAALELARSGAAVGGVVTFHGGLDSPTPADGKNIKGKVLLLHGAADPYVKKADIEACLAELDAAKVDGQKVDYAGAVHSFTQLAAGRDPSAGAAYDERADRRSWEAMKSFLAEVLR
jgi:dienelactone hydrolase